MPTTARSNTQLVPASLKADILSEALPYIERFHGKSIVIKYGGNAMADERLQRSFARDVVLLKLVGMNPVEVRAPEQDHFIPVIGLIGTGEDGLTASQIDALFKDGTISGGMLPKLSSALSAARNGVNSVHIIDGRVDHCLLLEILTPQGVGTMIHADKS